MEYLSEDRISTPSSRVLPAAINEVIVSGYASKFTETLLSRFNPDRYTARATLKALFTGSILKE